MRRAISSSSSSRRLRVLREEVAVLLHELLEAGVLTTLVLVEHLVERAEHVLHALHVARAHVLHAVGHLVDHLLHQLLAQLVHHLFEPLLCLARLEVVRAELADLAGEIVRHEVEAHVALGGGVARCSGPAIVAAALGVAECVLDRVPLLVDDVVQLGGDLVVHAAEVVLVEALLALLAELGEEIAEAVETLTVGPAHAVLHHAAQRSVDVAVVQQLVGELAEQGVGVEIEAHAGCRPTGST